MRKALRWLLSLAVLIGTVSATGASVGAATAANRPRRIRQAAASSDSGTSTDIKDRILAIPGMSLIEEKPYTGYRYFVLNYTQPIDHRHPSKGTFQQRITLLHKDTSRPTVFYTSGYNVSTNPSRREPTRIVDGNQVSLEYRFFTPSRPAPGRLVEARHLAGRQRPAPHLHRAEADLRQELADHRRLEGRHDRHVLRALLPADMDGVVAYVAPNDVVNKEDSAYDRFFANVGTKECRDRLNAVQREALSAASRWRRSTRSTPPTNGYTFNTVGIARQGVRGRRPRLRLGASGSTACSPTATPSRPTPRPPPTRRSGTRSTRISGFSFYTDQGLKHVHAVLLPGGHAARLAGHQAALARATSAGTATSRRATSCRATSR